MCVLPCRYFQEVDRHVIANHGGAIEPHYTGRGFMFHKPSAEL